jgi:hypothetical protein
MGAFGSPVKKLLMSMGEDAVISPFKANRPDTSSQSRCINLLEQIPLCSVQVEEPLARISSFEESLGGNLLQESKRQAQTPPIQVDISAIVDIDVPIINYGRFISTKVLGSTLLLTNKTKEEQVF